MKYALTPGYYDQLRHSVDAFTEMDLPLVPCINEIVSRDEYTGFSDYQDLVSSGGCIDPMECTQLGLQGLETAGHWINSGEYFNGFFPFRMNEDGTRILIQPTIRKPNPEQAHKQIQLAEQYQVPLGLSVQTFSIGHLTDPHVVRPNAVIESKFSAISKMKWPLHCRLETDGEKYWCYARLPFEDDEKLRALFAEKRQNLFAIDGTGLAAGLAIKHHTIAVAPSYVLDRQIRLVSATTSQKFMWTECIADLGMRFCAEEVADDSCINDYLDKTEQYDNYEYVATPEEDNRLFEESVRRFEGLESKNAHQNPNNTASVNNTLINSGICNQSADICLSDIFPPSIAKAIQVIGKHLPYDNVSMAMVFMTSMANMLRLGTRVNGNEATNYEVPINIYLALVARSGKKKTPLLKFLSDNPVSEVLQQIALSNTRMMTAWKNENQAKKKEQRAPRPTPLELRINDYTGEALVVALKKSDEQSRAILIERDEIKAIFSNLNAYRSGRGSDEQQLLELYDGTPYRSLRIGDTDRGYSRAAVNILGAIQPGVLEELIRQGDDSGQWARFAFSILPDRITPLPTVPNPDLIKSREAAAFELQEVAKWLYELPAKIYFLDAGSVELFSSYEFEKQKDALSATLPAHASLLGKSAGKVLRYAGLLHLLWSYKDNYEVPQHIPLRILQKSIRLCELLDKNTLDLHSKVAIKNQTTTNFSPFTSRIHQIALKCKGPISWTEIRKQMSSVERKGKTVVDARQSMKQLEDAGLGKIIEGRRGGLAYKSLQPLP